MRAPKPLILKSKSYRRNAVITFDVNAKNNKIEIKIIKDIQNGVSVELSTLFDKIDPKDLKRLSRWANQVALWIEHKRGVDL